MKTPLKKLAFLLALILLIAPVLSACDVVSVVEESTVPDETEEATTAVESTVRTDAQTTAAETTAATTAQTTAAPETTAPETTAATTGEPEPPAEDPFVPTVYEPAYDEATETLIENTKTRFRAETVSAPSRVGVAYARTLPLSCDPERAETREELIEIANRHAFYRESGFTVTLGYTADDAEDELNFLYKNSGFLPSQCALSGTLDQDRLTVDFKFYPESYLAVPRVTVPASVIVGEVAPPSGAETFPGLDPEHGVSVWDSEQAVYALTHGCTIAPIAGSPAESLVETAKGILSGMIDDSMTEWEIAYRVYLWLLNHAVYDWDGEGWVYNTLDRELEPDMISARMISFRAEGPLLYEVGACFGFAKASALLLGLEGITVRRTVAFDLGRLGNDGRTYIQEKPGSPGVYYVLVHSYLYLTVGGLDYIFDPTYSVNSRTTVRTTAGSTASVAVWRDFCIGTSYSEHRKVYTNYSPDPIASSPDYNPGQYNYLEHVTYDGTHDLILSSRAEVQTYYAYLLANVFSKPAEFRTVTLFYSGVSVAYWNGQYKSDLTSFLNQTGVPYSSPNPVTVNRQGVSGVMVTLVFGK